MSVIDELIRDEGYRRYPYDDSEGYLTIGIGFLIDEKKGGGLSREECELILERRVQVLRKKLQRDFLWYRGLNDTRQNVILNMVYNLGFSGVLNFKKMVACLQEEDYSGASKEMLDSRWADQVGVRAKRLAREMERGKKQ